MQYNFGDMVELSYTDGIIVLHRGGKGAKVKSYFPK